MPATAPLDGVDAGSAGSPLDGVGLARRFGEGFDGNRRCVSELCPGLGQAAAHDNESVWAEVKEFDPRVSIILIDYVGELHDA